MKNNYADFFYIWAIVFTIYLVTNGDVTNYYTIVVPMGDGFTYTNSWLSAVSAAQENYILHVLRSIFNPESWYMFHTISIGILSPFLTLNPVSISLVNFCVLIFTCMAIYVSMSKLKTTTSLPLAAVLLYLLMPWHYGLINAISLYVLQLDTAYINLLFAMCFLCVAAFEAPKISIRILHINFNYVSILFGITAGLAVWSRSNAPPTIFICLMAIVITWMLFGRKSFKEVFSVLIVPFIIFLVMTVYYYAHHLEVVMAYYAPLQELTRGELRVDLVLNQIKSVPGMFIVGENKSPMAIGFSSIVSHSLVMIALIYSLLMIRNKKAESSDLLIISGSIIYGGIMLFLLLIFHGKDTFYYQPYAPMLIGLFFILVGFLLKIIKKLNVNSESTFISGNKRLAVFFFVLIYAHTINSHGTQIRDPQGSDDAQFVRMVTSDPEKFIGSGRVAFLWYAMYSTPIFNYYRRMQGKPDIQFNNLNEKFSFYSNKYWPDLWIPAAGETRSEVRRAIKLTLEEADIFIVPEDPQCYKTADPYPLYRNYEILFEELNALPTPLFVTSSLRDRGCNLLVLSKKNETGLLQPTYSK
jgi:hypothetical protein